VEGTHSVYARAIKRAARFSALVPFTRAVLLTGSYSRGTATVASDIDLVFVAAPGRVWTQRFFAEIISRTLRIRRTDKKNGGRVCFSLSVSAAHAAIPNQDIVSAHFYRSLIPLWESQAGIVRSFQQQNRWMHVYCPEDSREALAFSLHAFPVRNMLRRGVELFLERTRVASPLEQKLFHALALRIVTRAHFFKRCVETRLMLSQDRIYYHFPYSAWVRKRRLYKLFQQYSLPVENLLE
jgi:predicted nucleotidyltransferase